MKLGIRFAVLACVCASMSACSSGSDSEGGSAGSSAQGGSSDAGRGGEVATDHGGAGTGGTRVGTGGAEVTYGGSVGAGGGSGGSAPSTGGAASGGGAGGEADSSGAGGEADASGAGGAASNSGAGGEADSSGAGGAAGNSGAGGVSSAPKCSTPTLIGSNAVARDTNGEGLVTETDVCVPELGIISTITLKYKLTKFFGDPARQAVFAYDADFSIYNAFWVAQVMTTSGDPVMVDGKLVYVSWLEGSWPPPGGTFGTDSTGSPWWYETFSYYSGGMMRDGYVDETNAKAIYAAGFTLDRLRMVKVNGKPVLY